jgi:hypothetical protein
MSSNEILAAPHCSLIARPTMVQRRTTGLWHRNLIQTRGSSQIPRSVGHSEAVQKRNNSRPSHLTCMTYVRHVGPKRVMHRLRYTTYAFKLDGQGHIFV